jgi:hypothetical protein
MSLITGGTSLSRRHIADLNTGDLEEYRKKLARLEALETNPYDMKFDETVRMNVDMWEFKEYIWNKYGLGDILEITDTWAVDPVSGLVFETQFDF